MMLRLVHFEGLLTSTVIVQFLYLAASLTDEDISTTKPQPQPSDGISEDGSRNSGKEASAVEDGYPCLPPDARAVFCDKDCQGLQDLMMKSPALNLEKGVIYVLTKPNRILKLTELVQALTKYFPYAYPLVIFYESMSGQMKQMLRDLANRPVFFQLVNLKTPNGIEPPGEDIPCFSKVSYRNMCRWQAKCVYHEPILQDVDYFWRLDDDSNLTSPINFDVFRHMREHGYLYGYMFKIFDSSKCTIGLWDAAEKFIEEHSLEPSFFHAWPNPRIFYNNFEISKASLWKSELYVKYVNYLDSLLGIYNHRWGDAPIKGLFVSMVADESQVRWFGDLGYEHNNVENVPVDTQTAMKKPLFEEWEMQRWKTEL